LKVAAIIVAAGSGKRIGGSLPKQFHLVGGRPILFYTLDKFERCPLIGEIVIIAAGNRLEEINRDVVERFGFKKVHAVVAGGAQRQDSVYRGIQALSADSEMVAVHDGVRPFVTVAQIEATIAACREHGAAILAVPPKDTIKRAADGFVAETLDRSQLWAVQTPQVFKVEILRRSHELARETGFVGTDDAALVERAGHRVKIVAGDDMNMKITVPMDLKIAEFLLGGDR